MKKTKWLTILAVSLLLTSACSKETKETVQLEQPELQEEAQESVEAVKDDLSIVSAQVYLDYNDKIVTSSQVLSAIDMFSNDKTALLISTESPIVGKYSVSDGSRNFINYGLVLEAGDDKNILTLKEGVYETNSKYAQKDGKVIQEDITKTNVKETIKKSKSKKFKSNLIKDAEGTTLGIVFAELVE